MVANAPKTGLMTLPVEVRQAIIKHLAHTPSDPPSSPSVVNQQDYRPLKPGQGPGWNGGRGIWQRPPMNPLLNTMLVNHQLHEEVKFCLQTVPQRYHLDVMNVKTYGLWTTWSISKAPPQQYIETVSCTFRLFEPTPDLDDRFAGSVNFRRGCGGPPLGVWSFYELLTRLFTEGPGYCTRKPERPQFVVGTIVVDFLAPTDGAAHSSFAQPEAIFQQSNIPGFRRWDGRRGEHAPEKALADHLIGYLIALFEVDKYTIRYGSLLWESLLHRLVLRANGKEYKTFDVEHICQTHEPRFIHDVLWSSQGPQRVRDLEQYKKWVLERREMLRNGQEVNDECPFENPFSS